MNNFEWRKKYAPNGYLYLERVLDFHELLLRSDEPAPVLCLAVWNLQREIKLQALQRFARFDPEKMFTRISVHPRDVGEHLNRLDPLKLRWGLKIHVRYSAP